MLQTDSAEARDDSTFFVSIHPHVVHEDFDGEVIILNLNIGLYHALNETAGFIWLKVADRARPESIVADVARKYEVSDDLALSMVASVLREIEDQELIKVHGARPAWLEESSSELEQSGRDADWPVVETYRDMHAALVLDPIHEVDEAGWPMPKIQTPANGPE